MVLVRLLVHPLPHQLVRGFVAIDYSSLSITDRHQDEAIIALELEPSDIVHSVTPRPGMILYVVRYCFLFRIDGVSPVICEIRVEGSRFLLYSADLSPFANGLRSLLTAI